VSNGGAFLRLFCRVTPTEGQGNSFADLSFVYFKAFLETRAPIRVLSTNMADLGASGSRWSEYSHVFVEPVPKLYINVVIGDNGELVRLYTVGTKNIAITASWAGAPKHDEIISLQLYDSVICPSEEESKVYRDLGIPAMYLEPVPEVLASLIRGFL
jgi:hypothetical protein